jgi:uncharacterized membrane-anchored protein
MRRRPIEQGRFDDRGVGGLVSKVPHVTVVFWVIKLLATTLGETGGDALSMSLDLGYHESIFGLRRE